MDPDIAAQLIVLVILILLSAFFSSAETALTTVNRILLRSRAEEGDQKAALVLKLVENQSKLLNAILIGNNIVNLSASALTTVFATKVALKLGAGTRTATAVTIATAILTIIIVIFGEIVPKTAAAERSERMSLAYSKPIYFLTVILTPVIFFSEKLSGFFLRLFGIHPGDKKSMTEDELLTIIDVSHEDGVLESEEKEMIANVMDFGDSQAKDVMVPRIDVVFASVETTYSELVELFKSEGYSRIPVYEESRDNVIGVVNLKDLFFYSGTPEDFVLRDNLREPFFTYEYQKTSDLLIQMRQQARNIAIVLDEYGSTAGVITLEDLLEEIVGEIRDEYDEEEEDIIQKISDTEYVVDGLARLDDLNDVLGTHFEETEDYDSIAGHMMAMLEHIPTTGEEYTTEDGVRLVIDAMDKNRVETVHIYLPPKEED